MKPANASFWNLHRRFSSNLGAKLICFLIAFSMLTYECSDGLAAVASERIAPHADAASGEEDGRLARSNAETAPHDGEPPQDGQGQANEKSGPPTRKTPIRLTR